MQIVNLGDQVGALQTALLAVDRSTARALFMEGVRSHGAVPFMETTVGAVMDRIGAAWERGELALSQVYMAGRICEELALAVLPEVHADRIAQPSVALGVYEDRHLLGKQLVQAVLRNAGFAVKDLGVVDLNGALRVVRNEQVDVLLLSCLMLSSALRIAALCNTIKSENLAVKVVVGGAPFRFDTQLWREIGADAVGTTASQAPGLIRGVCGTRV